MGSVYTKRTAKKCAIFMDRAGCRPRTILNLGAGSFAEIHMWKFYFPDARLLAVDPKEARPESARIIGSWKDSQYVRAALGDGSSSFVAFCVRCRSTVCKTPEKHKRRRKHIEVPSITLDALSDGSPSPFFVWMDIDGAELQALAGGTKTLEKTEWLCVELVDWIPGHANRIRKFLENVGFRMKHRFEHDGLFRKVDKT